MSHGIVIVHMKPERDIHCRVNLAVLVAVLAIGAAYGQTTYTNLPDAIAALAGSDNRSTWPAVEYLAKHPEQSVPPLMQMVEKQEAGWVFACAALTRSKDARVVPFYIRLLQNNFYAKEEDGTRKQYGFGTKNGCVVLRYIYGGALATNLGDMGDKRAVPVLEDAAKQGDPEVRTRAYQALYKLEAISLDQLFEMAKRNSDPRANIPNIIQGIGWVDIYPNTRAAIMVFDRVIAELPDHEYEVAAAHFWKVQCYELLKQYDDAIRECDEVMKFAKYDNLTSQIKGRRPGLKSLSEKNVQTQKK